MSHKEEILQHLKQHKTITSMEAIQLYGITRLAVVIHLLKKDGHRIISTAKEGHNKNGHRTAFAEYKLIELAEQAGE